MSGNTPPKISILLTAWKEAGTVGRAIETFINGYLPTIQAHKTNFELILGAPDEETHNAARELMEKLGLADRLVSIFDPGKGKPYALNMMMKVAKGDFWFFGDGDVYYGKNVIEKMLSRFEQDPGIQAVTGRPVSADSEDTMMGYWGHLLADAAHHKRMIDLTNQPQGRGKLFVKKRPFFPVSGYLFAMRRASNLQVPSDTLVEDAYISYMIHNSGKRIAYEPEAIVYVKYARTLDDYFKQKKRSVGGYVQLWKYNVVKPETNTRSFGRELEYFWFPIRYARNFKQFCWSLLLYPTRLWLWIQIFWERRIQKKDFVRTWVRVESTK